MTRPLHLLWLNSRLLHPPIGGDRIRTYKLLKELHRRNRITYLAFQTPKDLPNAAQLAEREYCREVRTVHHADTSQRSILYYAGALRSTLGRTPYVASKYRSRTMARALEKAVRECTPDLVVCDYLSPMVNVLPANLGDIPVVIFQHNVESLIWKRHWQTAGTLSPMRWIAWRQWKLTERFEQRCAARVNGQITVSEDDSDWFKSRLGMDNILGAVPTGVDCEELQPNPARRDPNVIAFLGSMDWHANVDAVRWFVESIYPSIKKEVPQARFLIIGRNPAPAVQALAAADSSLELTGTVDDIQPHITRASAMVLPLRVGGGTRIKVYEAMAMGVPVVSTKVGTEGLAGQPGEHFLAADDPESFARETIRLLQNPPLQDRLAENALHLVRTNYQWSTVADQFQNLCLQAVATYRKKDVAR